MIGDLTNGLLRATRRIRGLQPNDTREQACADAFLIAILCAEAPAEEIAVIAAAFVSTFVVTETEEERTTPEIWFARLEEALQAGPKEVDRLRRAGSRSFQ